MGNARLVREKEFYDELVTEGSRTRTLLDRFSGAFYDKGPRGRLWRPVWQDIDLRGATVLDYCCGNGGFSHLLSRLGATVSGVDISPQLIEQARLMGVSERS